MENIDGSQQNSFKRKHFARLHNKIQRKYEEMQRRLEKSKSVEVLSSSSSSMSEDCVYKEPRYASNIDISRIQESSVTETDVQNVKHTMTVEDVKKYYAILQYLNADEAEISEVETLTPSDNHSITHSFFGEDFFGSLESLNEVAKENDDNKVPPTPTQTIRSIIGSRISAAKDKRRQSEKEKNSIKVMKKESREKVEKFILSNTTKQDIRIFKRTKVATVTVALIEATGLETDNLEDKFRFLFCRLRLGTEKQKSKLIKSNTSEVKWQELFNFNLSDDSTLEISLWDKDNCLGRTFIDIIELEKERTHKMRINLESEQGNVQIFILLTISGIPLTNTLVDSDDYEETQRRYFSARKKFAWYNVRNDSADVGWISIIVFGAKGLIGHDCYCVLELDNERLQTHTEYKTQSPNWMKIFSFAVTDVTSILHVTVHDEKKSEDIGRLSIPLLKVNSCQKKWYALKDSTSKDRAKGSNPRILLEMRLTWNLLKASLRVIHPKESFLLETEDKPDRHLFARNISRAKIVTAWILNAFKVVKTCFEWESRQINTIALVMWLVFCWFFKMWMLPLLLLIPFIWYRPPRYFIVNWKRHLKKNPTVEDETKKEEKKTSLRQKVQGLQEVIQTVQNFVGDFASLGESIKNLYNFTVPFLSVLAIFLVIVIAFIMYMIPTKYIFMIWGIHKYTRKILRPNRIPNNEILDLLSRVPDDEALINWEELPLEEVPDEDNANVMI